MTKYERHRWIRVVTNPLLIASIALFTLSVLNLSGSSIGIYSAYFGNSTASGIVNGAPMAIRSDEWLVNSQMLIAQSEAGYPYINQNIGNGQNMSLVLDVPYLEWSVLLKPQNWIFFIAPFEFAFAFKWWFVFFILFAGVYSLVHQIVPTRKRIIATLIALIFCASPFVQWWLTPGTTLILGFSFLIAAIIVRIHATAKNKIREKLLLSSGLGYLIACFAVLLYPPFQIPCVLAIAIFYAAFLLKHRKDKTTWKNFYYIAGASAIGVLITLLYLLTRWDDVQLILHTAYPGERVIESGGVPALHVLSNFISPLLQSVEQAKLYTDNQSEASNFTLPFITIILLSIFTLWQYFKKYKTINISIISLLILFGLFFARMTLPFGDVVYKFLLLGSVPNLRLIIGLGVISVILLALNTRYILKEKTPYTNNQRWLIVLINTLLYSSVLFALIGKYPGFIPNTVLAIGFLVISTLICLCFVNKRIITGLAVLTLFSFASVYNIHPIQKDTNILRSNPVSLHIKELRKSNPNARWIVSNQIQLENIASINGAHSLSGVFTIPQQGLFNSLAPNTNPDIYNRYAHVQYDINSSINKGEILLLQADAFTVRLNPCDSILKKLGVEYIVTSTPIDSNCTEQIYTYSTPISEPSKINIYKVK